MKVSFSGPVILLNGENYTDPQTNQPISIGRVISNFLVNETKGDSFKFYDWAKKMYDGGTIYFDRGDQDTIKNAIKQTDKLSHLVKAQFLELFEKKEEKSPEEKS